jgi:hypothetical protein
MSEMFGGIARDDNQISLFTLRDRSNARALTQELRPIGGRDVNRLHGRKTRLHGSLVMPNAIRIFHKTSP